MEDPWRTLPDRTIMHNRRTRSWILLAVLGATGLATSWGCDLGGASTTANSSGAVASDDPSSNSAESTAIASAASASATKPKLKPGAKTVALERAGDKPYDKTFDDLRFDIQPGDPFHREMLPDTIEDLAGKRLRIRGFILPTAQRRGITQFVLVRDNQECCFGPGAALYDCILVEMQKGQTAEYSIRPVAVEGLFDINEIKGPDGRHLAIYHLDAESVK
jgi:hypothetical protein